jgi:glycosyltransferase involved in cell wall biosynthesis
VKISVIIPAFNAGGEIEQALSSIWQQTYTDFEIIVMDGGSTDQTVEILKRNNPRITFWYSGKDSGTTEAMNNGLAKATGDLVTFLCTDDVFKDSKVFADVIEHFRATPETQVLCCDLEVRDPKNPKFSYISKSDISQMGRRMSVHMPGAFLRREVMQERQFSSKVELANDYEFFAYLLTEKKARFAILRRVTVLFSAGGRTNQPWTDFPLARECFYIRRRYFSKVMAVVWLIQDLMVATLRRFHIRPKLWLRNLSKNFKSA